MQYYMKRNFYLLNIPRFSTTAIYLLDGQECAITNNHCFYEYLLDAVSALCFREMKNSDSALAAPFSLLHDVRNTIHNCS